jgi:hypothetical protein
MFFLRGDGGAEMIAHPETDWQSRRNRFNHDWLKNRFLLALGKLINVLDDRIEDDEFLASFVGGGIKVWEAEYPQVLSLIASFSAKMSPKVLFDRPPMSRWPKEKTWLPTVVDLIWRNRVQANALVQSAHESATSANEAYVRLRSQWGAESVRMSVERLRKSRAQIVEFRDACQELARVIEKFPNRILVT